VLFRIHKYFLTKYSAVFEDLFRMKSPESQPEGLSDQSPINLRGDDPVDFCRLFRLFYHEYVNTRSFIDSSNESYLK